MKNHSFATGVTAIALAITSIFPATGVFANTVASTDYTGNPITLRRTVSGVSNPVTNTFTYSITESSTPTGGSTTNAPTAATIAFNSATPTDHEVSAGTTVDFSNTNYSKVGDYIYTLTESGSSDASNYPIDTTNNDYKVTVQVRYATNAANVPDNSRYTAHVIIENNAGTKVNQATWGSSAARTYIQASAITTGNMAELDKCFAYTIDILPTGSVAQGDTFTIISSTECTGGDTTVSAGTPAVVYLKHNESVTVGIADRANYQLPVSANYTWTKTDTDDGYTTKMDEFERSAITKIAVATDAPTFEANNTTKIENNRQSDPLTGIVTNYWFYLMLLIAGLCGLYAINRQSKEGVKK